jgi:hypothetical protein
MIEPVEVPHHHAQSAGHGSIWFERVLGLAILVISVVSVWMAHHTGRTMEELVEQNARLVRAQSTPLLQLDHFNESNGKEQLTISVQNYGTGPARIAWLDLKVMGHPAANPSDIAEVAGAKNQVLGSSAITSTLIKSGESRTIFSWPKPKATDTINGAAWANLDQGRFRKNGLVARACYCSLLGQCWDSVLDGRIPTPVDACDARGHASYRG